MPFWYIFFLLEYLKVLFVQMYFQPMVVADLLAFVVMSVVDYLVVDVAAVVVEWIDSNDGEHVYLRFNRQKGQKVNYY